MERLTVTDLISATAIPSLFVLLVTVEENRARSETVVLPVAYRPITEAQSTGRPLEQKRTSITNASQCQRFHKRSDLCDGAD